MAATRDQVSNVVSATAASIAVTWPVNPTAGAKVLLGVIQTTATLPASVADNGVTPTTFVLDVSQVSASHTALVYRGDNITNPGSGAYTVTVTAGSGTPQITGMGQSYLGVAPGGPGTATNKGSTTSTFVSTGAVVPLVQGSLFFAVDRNSSGLNPETITLTGAGFVTVLQQTNGASFEAGATADKIATDSAANICTWHLGDSVLWDAAMAAYGPITGGTGSPFYPRPANQVFTDFFIAGRAGAGHS